MTSSGALILFGAAVNLLALLVSTCVQEASTISLGERAAGSSIHDVIYFGLLPPIIFDAGFHQSCLDLAGTFAGLSEDASMAAAIRNATSTPSESHPLDGIAESRARRGARAVARLVKAAYETLVALRPLFAAASVALLLFSYVRRWHPIHASSVPNSAQID